MAQEIKDKTRANFCEWFQPKPHARPADDFRRGNARDALESLFGGPDPKPGRADGRSDLDRLFGD